MNMLQRMLFLFTTLFGVIAFGLLAHATPATKLTLNATSGDAVQVIVSGDVTSPIQLSYLPPGAGVLRTIVLGNTDANGNFSTSLSSGGYAIPAGSPVFASVSGMQSPMALWPTYTSTLTLNQTSVQLAVGQAVTINGSATLILAANSQTAGIATSITGSQVTITGLASGSGTVTVCAANLGCNSVAVTVGAQVGQTQIAFSPDNPTMNVSESKTIVILGGGTNGYTLSSNSNASVVDAKMSGTKRTLSLFGLAAGTSSITVCSIETPSNCSSITVTVFDTTAQTLSFIPDSLTLIPGLSQQSTVSGSSTDTAYFISSNSNSSVASATLSGKVVTVLGGSTVGSTVITVCSAITSNHCGTITVTLNNSSASASSTTLAFSQNVVTVAKDETTTVTVTGGNNSGYAVASNSNPSVVTPSVNGNSNVVSLYGNGVGTSVVSICSATSGNICASLYVTVSDSLTQIILSQDKATLTAGSKALISVTGGSSAATITSNTNPNVASAILSANGGGLVVTGGTAAGNTVITVCPTDTVTSKCATVTANNSPIVSAGATTPTAAPSPSPSPKSTPTKVVLKIKIKGSAMVNVRASNSVKSKALGTAKKDQLFTALESKGGWYKIQLSTKVRGWVSAKYAVKQ